MNKPLRLVYALALLLALQACSRGESPTSAGSYPAHSEQQDIPKTPAELRAELLAQEQGAPADYLKASGTYHRNFIDQLVLEGDIANTATLATYKDPVLSVTWYSKTQTELATKEYPVYELVRAQGTTHFKLKTDAPSDVATVAMGISGGTAVE